MSIIDQNKFYTIHEPTFMCCDQSQFRYVCKAHGESMGCYFCEFDYTQECGCTTNAITKGNA
jgi:hypothetical protein